ncbi:Ergosterol biosynthetic protein 28 [Wickerhamomyces ciferrii]|uniref:Ergosterol biosynthetic protein 28 n=1 Tax=Wickerhamomyces ciferrii (strain ATCC 14091 / BCRC 22168 / CBS 111 / JCM 3599 / NBRC 0793 / NRRL Y-1031 F-60-10) TaxID=1206466 RepID=K0KHM8_WICCF|nr:Ergosterol biosynthetic protein 28 [Wickerhamomyces ciferrii]CCH40668.1 Ergosterol biosynthetic protein 28 [Wickerhamomyces ciferrii]
MSSFIDFVGPYIPTTPGILPKWLLFVTQTYLSGLELTRRVYENKPQQTTDLSARTFGTWTFVSAVIRFYGAYYLTNPQIYQITLASYLIAFVHFVSEWLIFKTAKFGKGLLGPLIVATSTIVWMTLQKDYYTSLA